MFSFARVECTIGQEDIHGLSVMVKEYASRDHLMQQLDDAGYQKIVVYHPKRTVEAASDDGILVSQS